ncbi:hypothetical protein K3165_11530 [Qipengyuania sp. 1XM1-15A]|uniref:hypothetical protein n=1 Tax=Qipengyuania xiamenensis TaxID=2867237 RepID=UPI001C87D39E|nr:hypothetical protein [Qipengyuania xiamenensis]MBX7533554.1 hypothetical protein [Qipengyuania xiamenensis]
MTDSNTQPIPPQNRNPIIHDTGPSSYPGDWQVTDKALAAYKISRELFGTTEVVNYDGSTFRVKDYQYRLADGSVGMRLIPVNDWGPFPGLDGKELYGSQLVDEMLTKEMGLAAGDQIYAIIYFIHPELNKGDLLQFSRDDKVELGITHMGAYVGAGRTTNSPPLYHNRMWDVIGEPGSPFGYPANIAVVRMQDTDQPTLNKNLYLVDAILNNGVRFPTDYKNSHFRAAALNTAFMFYKDWVLEAQYLRTDSDWFTYCAAHKTLVLNVGLNLPHNVDRFKEVYGATEGAEFFKRFSEFHFDVFGTEFTEALQTEFEPLYQKQGIAPKDARAIKKYEFDLWNTARMNGKLAGFDGFSPLPLDKGTVWAAPSTADLVEFFIQMYCDLLDAGAIGFTQAAYGFADAVTERMRSSKIEYMASVIPVVEAAFVADAQMKAAGMGTAPKWADSPYYKETFAALYRALGGTASDPMAAADAAQQTLAQNGLMGLVGDKLLPELLTWTSLAGVRLAWEEIVAGGAVPVAKAYDDFIAAITPLFDADRDAVVTNPLGIQYNAPPSVGHMVTTGMYESNPFVTFTTVGTAMHYAEMEPKPSA